MRNPAEKIDPEDYILAVLTPKERLDTALKVAAQAFKGSKLTTTPRRGWLNIDPKRVHLPLAEHTGIRRVYLI